MAYSSEQIKRCIVGSWWEQEKQREIAVHEGGNVVGGREPGPAGIYHHPIGGTMIYRAKRRVVSHGLVQLSTHRIGGFTWYWASYGNRLRFIIVQ